MKLKGEKRLNYTLDAHIHTLICSHRRLIAGKWMRKRERERERKRGREREEIPMTFILINVSKRKSVHHLDRHLIQ